MHIAKQNDNNNSEVLEGLRENKLKVVSEGYHRYFCGVKVKTV